MAIGLSMIVAGVLPIPLVYLLRRFQILKVDLDIHQGSIRRNETTASTKQMMDDDDVSSSFSYFEWFNQLSETTNKIIKKFVCVICWLCSNYQLTDKNRPFTHNWQAICFKQNVHFLWLFVFDLHAPQMNI